MVNEKAQIKKEIVKNFNGVFEDSLIDEIAEVGNIKTFEVDNIMIDIDDELTHIPLIVDGVIKIMREDEKGEEIALYYLEPGDTCTISFVNCIIPNKSFFRGIVKKQAMGIFIPIDKVDLWLKRYKSWRTFIIDSYHNRLLEMVESIDRLAFLSLEDRLYKYLCDKAKIMNENTLIITHQEIAEDIHTSRVVVSRLLKRLENEGVISTHRNRIIVEEFN